MDAYTQALVAILATFLAVNLILWIIVLLKAIQILDSLKRLTEKAESVTDKASQIGNLIKNTGGVAAIGKVLFNVVKGVRHSKRKAKGKDE